MWRRIAPAERAATAPRVLSSSSRAASRAAVTCLLLAAPLAGWVARQTGWTRVGDACAIVTIVLACGLIMRAAGGRAMLLLAIVLAVLAGVAIASAVPAVYGPPVAINLAVATLFAASWWRGDPLVSRLARLQRHELTPEAARYTSRLTLVWAAYLALLGLAGIAIALHGDERLGAWWSGLLDYVLVAALFVGEVVYRRRSMRGFAAHIRSVRAAMRDPSA